MTGLRRICVTLSSSSLTTQAALATSLREGDYMAAKTGAQPPVQRKVTGVSKPYRKQAVSIEVKDCARTLVIHGDGAMPLRVADPGATNFCGQEATLPPAGKRLRCKVLATEGDSINAVRAVLVDTNSNHAVAAHYATGKQKGRDGRADAAAAACKGIGAPMTGLH